MDIKTVVTPVDFSEESIAAMEVAAWLASRSGATCEAVSVTTSRYAHVTGAALETLVRDSGQSWRVLLSDDDDVEATLVEAVLADRTSLWCVPSHGRTALGELIFGSVSAELVRDAQIPVVVVGRKASARERADVMVVALDGTELGERILPAAIELAARLKLRVRLIQVGHGHTASDSNDTAYLARVSARLPHPERGDYDTLYGDADHELVSYVERADDVAMLAMATRGVPAGARLSAPSTAMRVLRNCPIPLLLLHPPFIDTDKSREPTDDLRRRVVVGVDRFASSAAAVRWAATEAERRGVLLQVVHSWQLPVAMGSMYEAAVWPDVEGCREAAVEEMASVSDAIAAEFPDLTVETVVAEGRAADAITRHAEGAEMVVLGHRHHGRLSRLLHGSTSQATLDHLACPLVIVPCDDEGRDS